MTYTKSNGILKRLGALVMALGLTCALAVSASAVSAGDYTGTAYLKADVPDYIPHELKFIENVVVYDDEVDTTVVVTFQNPATVTVTPQGSPVSFDRTGTIEGVELSDVEENADYDATYDAATGTLTIYCSSEISAAEFAPKFDFDVAIDNGEDEGTTQHTAVSAWLYLAQQ